MERAMTKFLNQNREIVRNSEEFTRLKEESFAKVMKQNIQQMFEDAKNQIGVRDPIELTLSMNFISHINTINWTNTIHLD
jgi:hypothetical protein